METLINNHQKALIRATKEAEINIVLSEIRQAWLTCHNLLLDNPTNVALVDIDSYYNELSSKSLKHLHTLKTIVDNEK